MPDDPAEDLEDTVRAFRAFMDDPIALLERAADLLRRKKAEVATHVFFCALAGHLWLSGLIAPAGPSG